MNNKTNKLVDDRRSFVLKAATLGAITSGVLVSNKALAVPPDEIIDIPIEATSIADDDFFELQANGGGTGSTKKVQFEQIKRFANSISVLNFHKDVGTGDSAIDFTAINAGLAALQKGQSLYLPSDRSYKVDAQLTEPTVSHWGLISDVGAYAVIDISDLSTTEYLIAPSKRGWGIHNFYIYGNSGASGSDHNYTANGLKMSNAAFTMSHLRFLGLKKALHFDNAHDSQQIDSIECYSNHTDLFFGGVAHCSSLRFRNFSSVLSEISILQERDLINSLFDGCTFAPAPYDTTIKPVDFNHKIVGCCIRSSRFEMKDTNAVGNFWDAIYLSGFATNHPISNFSVIDNHFTGAINNAVFADRYVKGLKFHDNWLNSTPNNADLYLRGTAIETSIKRNNTEYSREIEITTEANSTMIEAVVDRSYPKYLNGFGSPENVVDAPLNSMYIQADGLPGSLFFRKSTAKGIKSGWIAVI